MECSPRQPGFAAHALHLLGDIATHPDRFDADRGEGHYRQALMLAEPRGMRPLVAHCHLGLGKLYRRTGQREQAREHLTTATTMYREMDMRFLASAGRGGDGSVTAKFIDVRAPDRRHRHYRKLRDSLSRC
jgi:hypothetical protein